MNTNNENESDSKTLFLFRQHVERSRMSSWEEKIAAKRLAIWSYGVASAWGEGAPQN